MRNEFAASALLLTVTLALTPVASGENHAPTSPRLVQRIPLPGVEGRFNHFAADVKGMRVFVAALGNNTVEVLDAKVGNRLHTITGLHEPQGLRFVPESRRLFVAGGGDGACRIYDTDTWEELGKI